MRETHRRAKPSPVAGVTPRGDAGGATCETFVSKKHPVIDLLRVNKDILNADIDTRARVMAVILKMREGIS